MGVAFRLHSPPVRYIGAIPVCTHIKSTSCYNSVPLQTAFGTSDIEITDINPAFKMSHSVTVTRTTTTSSTSAIIVNTGYMKTFSGILKFLELILGAVCVGLVGYYFGRYGTGTPEIFFLLMTTTFMIGTFCILLSCLISISTASILPKTIFEVVYHLVAFGLLLAAGLTMLVEVNHRRRYADYDSYMAASIICLVLAGLYLLSTIFAVRSYRGL